MGTVAISLLVLLLCVSGCLSGDVCYEYVTSGVSQFYCDTGCCGSYSDAYCCMSTRMIIGIVIGCFFLLVTVAAIVVCFYQHHQKKKQNKVQRLRNENQTQVHVTASTVQPPPYYGYGIPPAYTQANNPAYPPPSYSAPRGAGPWIPLSTMPYHEDNVPGAPEYSSSSNMNSQPPPPANPFAVGSTWNDSAARTAAPPTATSEVPPPSGRPTNPFRLNSLPPLPPLTAHSQTRGSEMR